jgi:hypothetical protein
MALTRPDLLREGRWEPENTTVAGDLPRTDRHLVSTTRTGRTDQPHFGLPPQDCSGAHSPSYALGRLTDYDIGHVARVVRASVAVAQDTVVIRIGYVQARGIRPRVDNHAAAIRKVARRSKPLKRKSSRPSRMFGAV